MSETFRVKNINLHLSEPHKLNSNWIGQREILKQVLACWLVVDEDDQPLTP